MEPELVVPAVTEAVTQITSGELYVVLGVIAVAVLTIARALWVKFKGGGENFDKYKSYAVMAAKFVEETVPDDFGADSDDSRMKRGAHKLDMFLKQFTLAVKQYEGKDANDKLKAKAMEWSVELAKSFVSKDKK